MKKITILFAFLLFLLVLNVQVNAVGCCVQKTNSDGTMMYCKSDDQSSCNGVYDNGRCENRAECNIGCCFVPEEKKFRSGISQIECVDYLEGIFDGSNADCSLTEGYQLGCCNIGDVSCNVVQKKECDLLASEYGIEDYNFDSSLTDPVSCINACYGGETGCCYIPDGCKNGITQGECFESGGEFMAGQLCTNDICDCDAGTKNICYNDDVVLADNCGVPKTDSSGNVILADNGNCGGTTTCGCNEYDDWGLCEQDKLTCIPSSCSVDVVFSDFGSVEETNKVMKNGETWCDYMMDISIEPNFKDTSGMVMANINFIQSRNNKAYENLLNNVNNLIKEKELSDGVSETVQNIVSGNEQGPVASWIDVFSGRLSSDYGIKPAFDYGRNHAVMTCENGQIKVKQQCDVNRKEICNIKDNEARCLTNSYLNCYDATSEEVCSAMDDCKWIDKWILNSDYNPLQNIEGYRENTQQMEESRTQLSLNEKVCVPKYQPGVANGEKNLCEICGQGSTNDLLNPLMVDRASNLGENFRVSTISTGVCGNNECRHLGDCQYELGWNKDQQRYQGICKPFEPKENRGDCRLCNNLNTPCTEDLCNKLGKNCQFLSYEGEDLADVNYKPGVCMDMDEEDSIALTLKLWDYPLDDYTFDQIVEENELKGYTVRGAVDIDKLEKENDEMRLGVLSNRQAGCFYYKDFADENPFNDDELENHRMISDDKFRHYVTIPLGVIFDISRNEPNIINVYCRIEESVISP